MAFKATVQGKWRQSGIVTCVGSQYDLWSAAAPREPYNNTETLTWDGSMRGWRALQAPMRCPRAALLAQLRHPSGSITGRVLIRP